MLLTSAQKTNEANDNMKCSYILFPCDTLDSFKKINMCVYMYICNLIE